MGGRKHQGLRERLTNAVTIGIKGVDPLIKLTVLKVRVKLVCLIYCWISKCTVTRAV